MRAILEFNLPEEQEEFELARNGSKLSCAISDFQDWLRAQIKHGNYDDEQMAVFERVREKFFDALNGWHL